MKRIVVMVLIGMFLFSSVSFAIPVDGLVAEYLFSGNANDTSGSENHGVDNGNLIYSDNGVNGQAVRLDGVDDWIVFPSNSNFHLQDMTISFWTFRSSANPPYAAIFSTDDWYTGVQIFFDDNNETLTYGISFEGSNDWENFSVSGDYANSEWIHSVCSYDGNEMKVYMNGILVGTNTYQGDIIYTDTYANYIGRNPINPVSLFDGMIDEMRVYNRALSDSEVNDLYLDGNPVPEPTTLFLLGTGIVGLAGARRRGKK